MSRLFTMSQVVRTVCGLALSLLGVALLVADSYVAYVTRASAHGLNLAIGALLVWAGGYVLDPKYVTTMVSSLVSELIPAIKAYAGGGGSFAGTEGSIVTSSTTTTDTLVPPPAPGKSKPPTFPPPTTPGSGV